MRRLPLRLGSFAASVACVSITACGDERPDDKIRGVPAPPITELVPASVALQGANIRTLDPATMDDAEIRKVIGPGPRCEFRYTSSGKPVLAVQAAGVGGSAVGVVKLNGKLIALRQAPAAEPPLPMVAEGIWLKVTTGEEARTSQTIGSPRVEASMRFELSQGLQVGYGGYHSCTRS